MRLISWSHRVVSVDLDVHRVRLRGEVVELAAADVLLDDVDVVLVFHVLLFDRAVPVHAFDELLLGRVGHPYLHVFLGQGLAQALHELGRMQRVEHPSPRTLHHLVQKDATFAGDDRLLRIGAVEEEMDGRSL